MIYPDGAQLLGELIHPRLPIEGGAGPARMESLFCFPGCQPHGGPWPSKRLTARPRDACTVQKEPAHLRAGNQFKTQQCERHSDEFPRKQAGVKQKRVPPLIIGTACAVLQCFPEANLLACRGCRFLAENDMSQSVPPVRVIGVAEYRQRFQLSGQLTQPQDARILPPLTGKRILRRIQLTWIFGIVFIEHSKLGWTQNQHGCPGRIRSEFRICTDFIEGNSQWTRNDDVFAACQETMSRHYMNKVACEFEFRIGSGRRFQGHFQTRDDSGGCQPAPAGKSTGSVFLLQFEGFCREGSSGPKVQPQPPTVRRFRPHDWKRADEMFARER